MAAVDDTVGEGKIARMNKEKHADGVTFGLIPEEEQAEDYSSAVEAYDYVLAVADKVVDKVKVMCRVARMASWDYTEVLIWSRFGTVDDKN